MAEDRTRTENTGTGRGNNGPGAGGRGHGGPGGRAARMMPGEKAKNFSKAIKDLLRYLKPHRIRVTIVFIFAIASTVFSILAPAVLGQATDVVVKGLMSDVGVDFSKLAFILAFLGGLYGVNIGSAFFGESMFSLVPSGSKLALIHLAQVMQELNGSLIDCQLETPHLKSMCGRFIDYDEYMRIINK